MRNLTSRQIAPYIICSMLGFYVFNIPQNLFIELKSKNLTILAVIISGIFSFFIGLCYAELGCRFPDSYGDNVYLEAAYGKMMSIIYSFSSCLVICPLFLASSILVFSSEKIVGFDNFWVRYSLFLAFFLFNFFFFELSIKVQNIFTYIKVFQMGAFVLFSLLSLFKIIEPSKPIIKDIGLKSDFSIKRFINAIGACAPLYDGFNSANFISFKIKNPRKTFYQSISFSVIFITSVFSVILFSIFNCVNYSEVLDSRNNDRDILAICCSKFWFLEKIYFAKIFKGVSLVSGINGIFIIIRAISTSLYKDYKVFYIISSFVGIILINFHQFKMFTAIMSLSILIFYCLSVASLLINKKNTKLFFWIPTLGLLSCTFAIYGNLNYIKSLI